MPSAVLLDGQGGFAFQIKSDWETALIMQLSKDRMERTQFH
jgi:hypothetical protein